MFSHFKEKFNQIDSAVPFRLGPALISIAVLVVLLLMPHPVGLTPKAWALVAIFATTILAIILKVMPIGVMAIAAIVIVSLSQVTATSSKGAIADTLASFSNPLIWLIVISIMISQGLKKTGLGKRIGLMFISLLGKRTLGVGYGLVLSELVLAPVMPSNTARGGGIVHPIMRSIANAFDSDPAKGTEGKVGTYLALVNYHTNPITSAMFLTATAPNPLVVDYIAKATNQSFHLSWTGWALGMLVPGLLCLLLMPLVIYWLSPPQIKSAPNAVDYARTELLTMGALSAKEKGMLATFVLLLVLWANLPALLFGPAFTLNPTVVAFVGLLVMVVTGIISWDDALSEKSAWDTLVWFGVLVMMAAQLNKTGVIGWLSSGIKDGLVASGVGWELGAATLLLVFVFSHYMFASTTAHISAMLLAFLMVGVQLVPAHYVQPFMLLMAAGSAIMMTLTHYATGTSPIVFNSGYVSMGKWWGVGFVMCLVNLLVFLVVGSLWWKVLGYW